MNTVHELVDDILRDCRSITENSADVSNMVLKVRPDVQYKNIDDLRKLTPFDVFMLLNNINALYPFVRQRCRAAAAILKELLKDARSIRLSLTIQEMVRTHLPGTDETCTNNQHTNMLEELNTTIKARDTALYQLSIAKTAFNAVVERRGSHDEQTDLEKITAKSDKLEADLAIMENQVVAMTCDRDYIRDEYNELDYKHNQLIAHNKALELELQETRNSCSDLSAEIDYLKQNSELPAVVKKDEVESYEYIKSVLANAIVAYNEVIKDRDALAQKLLDINKSSEDTDTVALIIAQRDQTISDYEEIIVEKNEYIENRHVYYVSELARLTNQNTILAEEMEKQIGEILSLNECINMLNEQLANNTP